MLLELQIQNFALIEKLKIEFGKGLNILTGETGAGKSIIIDSVNFVLGERSSKDIIRTGYDKAYVETVFENTNDPKLLKIGEENGIDLDQEVLILTRELSISGKSICRVNGKTVTTSILKSIGNHLMDIHGQHEHQSLLNEDNHIDLLDMFGGNSLNELKNQVEHCYSNIINIKYTLNSIMGDDKAWERKIDLLNFQINEIDYAILKDTEEEDLLKQKLILNNSNKLFSVLSSSYTALYENEDNNQSIFDRIGYILSELNSIIGIDNKLYDISKNISESYYLLEDAIVDIREYRDKIDFNPDLIDEVEQRLDLINKLKRKYGNTIKDIIEYRDTINKELEDICNSKGKIDNLKKQLESESNILSEKASRLSNLRKFVAKKLQSNIMNELKFLSMERSKFTVNFEIERLNDEIIYNEKGMDKIKFLISTNPGEPEKPLSKIASGGEISRIMLSIKAVLARYDNIPSLIFDEIDSGISGSAAQSVAEKLGQISNNHQVICVTHLPQIASMADTHFYISKSTISDKTNTHVEKLDKKSRIKEIARMLGGTKLTDLTLKHAEEIINMAHTDKQ